MNIFNDENSCPKVSIILPCYNVEQYLPEALDSCLNQTLENIEIIPVDDDSPDNCSKIIKDYSKKDKRIKPIYLKQNGGYGKAVNEGIKQATGEYIAILEPDDYVMEDYYYILYHEAIEKNLDICGVSSYCEVREGVVPRLIKGWYKKTESILNHDDIMNLIASGSVGITLKIYKKDFLKKNGIWLNDRLKAYHDLEFTLKTLLSAVRVNIIRGVGYYHRKDNINQSTRDPDKYLQIFLVADDIIKLIGKNRYNKEIIESINGYLISHLHYYLSKYSKRQINLFDVRNLFIRKISNIINNNPTVLCSPKIAVFLQDSFCKNQYIKIKKQEILNDIDDISGKYDINKLSTLHLELSNVYFYIYYVIYYSNNEHIVITAKNTVKTYITKIFIERRAKPLYDFCKWCISQDQFYYNSYFKNDYKFYVLIFFFLNKNYQSFSGNIFLLGLRNEEIFNYIELFPSICSYVSKKGKYLPPGVKKSAVVYSRIETIQKKFDSYIKGKSIAVVGNGASEIQKNKGSEIDSHDIVIRFNNYSLDEEYNADYGTKESVWGITPCLDSLHKRSDINKYEYIISPKSFSDMLVDRKNFFYNILTSGIKYFFFDVSQFNRVTNLSVPSVGLYILLYLAERLDLIKKINIYGFCSIENYQQERHYFTGDPTNTEDIQFHQWESEADIINQIKSKFNSYFMKKGI